MKITADITGMFKADGRSALHVCRTLKSLSDSCPECQIECYADAGTVSALFGTDEDDRERDNILSGRPLSFHVFRTVACTRHSMRTDMAGSPSDVYLGLSGNLPRRFRRYARTAVVAVYSLDFVSSLDGYSWIRRHVLNLKYRRICRRSDYFIVPDAGLAAGLTRYYYVPKDRIFVLRDNDGLQEMLDAVSRCPQRQGSRH